jgi:hypothetical protein
MNFAREKNRWGMRGRLASIGIEIDDNDGKHGCPFIT